MSFLNYMMKGLVKNMSNIWTIVKKELKRLQKGLQTALPYSIITNVVKKDGPLLQKLY